jgi:CheY-like chemotaxis protein
MKVLIVDDIFVNRLLSSRILEKRGHSVQMAENGRQAIELLENEDFDVVLMDLHMPVMDGYEAMRIIRSSVSQVRRRDIPVIAVTAIQADFAERQCYEAGMNGFISKPLRHEDFITMVERYAPEKIDA